MTETMVLPAVETDIRGYLDARAEEAARIRDKIRGFSDQVPAHVVASAAEELSAAAEWERIVKFIDALDADDTLAVRVAQTADLLLVQMLALAPQVASGDHKPATPHEVRAWADFVHMFHPLYHDRGHTELHGVTIPFGERRHRI